MAELLDNHVKFLFRFYSNLLGKWMVEALWAEIVDSSKGYNIAI